MIIYFLQYHLLTTTLNNVINSVSRVMFQLFTKDNKSKNVEVKSENCVKLLSTCGLRLERMLTYIVKKKKNFRIESINTDGTH